MTKAKRPEGIYVQLRNGDLVDIDDDHLSYEGLYDGLHLWLIVNVSDLDIIGYGCEMLPARSSLGREIVNDE